MTDIRKLLVSSGAIVSVALLGFALTPIVTVDGAQAAERRPGARAPGTFRGTMPKSRIRRRPRPTDCAVAFGPGAYRNDPQHARYYCKSHSLVCRRPYKIVKIVYNYGQKRFYYTCRIPSLTGVKPYNEPLCKGGWQNSMSAPNPAKHYFYYCISRPAKCSSGTYHVQNPYQKVTNTGAITAVGQARYDCKSNY